MPPASKRGNVKVKLPSSRKDKNKGHNISRNDENGAPKQTKNVTQNKVVRSLNFPSPVGEFVSSESEKEREEEGGSSSELEDEVFSNAKNSQRKYSKTHPSKKNVPIKNTIVEKIFAKNRRHQETDDDDQDEETEEVPSRASSTRKSPTKKNVPSTKKTNSVQKRHVQETDEEEEEEEPNHASKTRKSLPKKNVSNTKKSNATKERPHQETDEDDGEEEEEEPSHTSSTRKSPSKSKKNVASTKKTNSTQKSYQDETDDEEEDVEETYVSGSKRNIPSKKNTSLSNTKKSSSTKKRGHQETDEDEEEEEKEQSNNNKKSKPARIIESDSEDPSDMFGDEEPQVQQSQNRRNVSGKKATNTTKKRRHHETDEEEEYQQQGRKNNRKKPRSAPNRSESDSDDTSEGEEQEVQQSRNRNAENEEEEEEEVDPIVEFARKQKKYDALRSKLHEKTKEFRKKSVDPLRAEVFRAIQQFTKKDITTLKPYLPEVNFQKLCERSNRLNPTENQSRILMKAVEKVLEKGTTFVLSLMCTLQLQVLMDRNKMETVKWSAVALRPAATRSNSQSASADENDLKKLGKEWRRKLGTNLETEDSIGRFALAKTECNSKFVLMSVTILNKKKKRREEVSHVDTTIVAFEPGLKYLFVYDANSSATQLLIQCFASSLGSGYDCRSVGLKDVGLSCVYNACKKTVTKADKASLKRRLEQQDNQFKELNVQNFASHNDPEKKRKMMAELIDDKQEGGFQSLTFKIVPEDCDEEHPIKVRYTMKNDKGMNMDQMFAEMVRSGAVEDPTMYLEARAQHTNSVTKILGEN